MKFKEGQQFKTAWGIWVYQGITNCGDCFKCDKCGKFRTHLHEFLGYTNANLGTILSNPMGYNYHALYGSECIKSFIADLKQ